MQTIYAMRRNYTYIFLLITISMLSCKKEDVIKKPQISDIPYTLYDTKLSGDPSRTEVSYSTTFLLKSDFTWTLDLEGAKSFGTYTWDPTDNFFAGLKFNIAQWSTFSADTAISNKIKNVLVSVNRCSIDANAPVFDKNFETYLRVIKK
jgi:hypothetical protein